jgi:hypothetical protein
LRGQTFPDWERQVDTLRKAVLPTLLQEQAALDSDALVGGWLVRQVSAVRLGSDLSGPTRSGAAEGDHEPSWPGGDR